MADRIEKLGIRLILTLAVLLTLTVIIAGIIVYKTSRDDAMNRVAGYASDAADLVDSKLDQNASLNDIKMSLFALQAKIASSLWIIDHEGNVVLSLNPEYRTEKKFADESLTISAVEAENGKLQALNRREMESSLTLRDIFDEDFSRGFGTYAPVGLGNKVIAFHLLKEKKWLVGVDIASDAIYSELNNLKLNIIKLCILIFIATLLLSFVAVKKLVKPYYKEQYILRKKFEINNDKLRQLYELNNVMQQKLSSGDKFDLISQKMRDLLKIDRISLFLLEKDENSLKCITTKEDITKEQVTLNVPITKEGGIISKSFREKKVISYHVTDEETPEEYRIGEEIMQGTDLLSGALVALPLIVNNKCIGVAIADNHLKKSKVTRDTIDFLEIVMNQAAVAIENISLFERIKRHTRELETTDNVAGIYNLSYFKENLAESIEKCMKDESLVTLGIVHINNFRIYNERNGHKTGDDALKKISYIFDELSKDGYVVGRCYGAEFGVIFNGMDEKSSINALEKIRDNIQRASFKGIGKLTEEMFTLEMAVKTYVIDDEMTPDEFFKDVEDMVRKPPETFV